MSRPSCATGKAESRLGAVFLRQHRHLLRIDIWRVGDDQIVASPSHRREQIALQQADAIAEAVVGDIGRGKLQRVGRNVDGVDTCLREGERGKDGERAGPGAEFEDRARLFEDEWRRRAAVDTLREHLADEGARHQSALIGAEGMPANIGAAEEIGCRLPGVDPLLDEGAEAVALGVGQSAVAGAGKVVDRKAEPLQHDEGGFVIGRGRAVAEMKAGCGELLRGPATISPTEAGVRRSSEMGPLRDPGYCVAAFIVFMIQS